MAGEDKTAQRDIVVGADLPLMLIGICTRKRHASLDRLLVSFTEMTLPLRHKIALVIVENDTELTVDRIVADRALPFPADVVLEPNAGLSNARNRLLEEADSRGAAILICVDDDEIVLPGWARGYEVGFERLLHRDVLMGWVDFAFEGRKSPWMTPTDLGRQIFGRRRNIRSTTNYAMRRAVFAKVDGLGMRFDTQFNTSGGEDTEFFMRLSREHARYTATVPQARSVEYITEDRATLRWMLSRAWTQNIVYFRILHDVRRKRRGHTRAETVKFVLRISRIRLWRALKKTAFIFRGTKPLLPRLQENAGLILVEIVSFFAAFGFIFGAKANTYMDHKKTETMDV